MTTSVRRTLGVLTIPLFALVVTATAVAPASAANPTFAFNWKVNASTHLAKLDQTVKVPQGTFSGQVDLVTGKLTGSIKLPPATTTMQIAGIGLANATFRMNQVKPVSGHVDIKALKATATSVLNIRVLQRLAGRAAVGEPRRRLVHDVDARARDDVGQGEPHGEVHVPRHVHDPAAQELWRIDRGA